MKYATHTSLPMALAALMAVAVTGCTPSSDDETSQATAQNNTVEVLHWWTSGGEAAAIAILKEDMAKQGIGWNDVPVAGGGGAAAMTALKMRVVSGNPPTAAQLSMAPTQEWAAEGLLEDVSDLAQSQNWDSVLPAVVKDIVTYEGRWIGTPINLHRANWMWMNAKVFADNNLSPPTSWDEFYAAGDILKAKGIIPLAMGSEPWQEILLFQSLVVAVGGPQLYQNAVLELQPEALGSAEMVQVFDHMRRLKGYIDANTVGRAWNEASAMVMNGQAAMQLMGDWVKGEITNAKLVPGEDILCTPAPGTAGTALVHGDIFVMFHVGDDGKAAQRALASNIMDPAFQERFNLLKGSAPARLDVSEERFDSCGQQSMRDIRQAMADGSLYLDMDGNAALPPALMGVFFDVVTQHFNSDQSSADAVAALVRGIEAVK